MKTAVVLAAAALGIGLGVTSGQASRSSPIVFAADRAPSVTGEIYRLDPNGHRVDLSRSPYRDSAPAVSSDGEHVAFVSERTSRTSIYEVGSGGRGLVRLGPWLAPLAEAECAPRLAWQPGGAILAASACGRSNGKLWVVGRGRRPLALLRGADGIQGPSWSPDGRVLLASSFEGVTRAFSAAGDPLWKVWGECCGSWSRNGLLALGRGGSSGFAVYDEQGHLRFGASGRMSGGPSWSPDGVLLATLLRNRLEVRTQAGVVILRKSLGGQHGLAWSDDRHVIVGGYGSCYCRARSVDVGTGRVSAASGRWFDPLSADRELAIVTPRSKAGFSLGVARPGGGPVTVYRHIGGCSGDGVWMPAATSLQFAGRSRSLVYQSWNDCDAPFSNLYSVAPGGSDVRRLTNVQAQETQPALSPDGSEIAYVWADANGLSCKGCSDGIRLASAGGRPLRTLTNPEDCTFDDSPAWSPAGQTILFSRSSCDTPPELYTVSATGGQAHDLGIAGREAAWGPSRIAYVAGGVWSARPDGTDRTRIGAGSHPAWSADGRLAYLSGRTVVVGTSHVPLPFASISSLAWSPDGTRFVVTAMENRAAAPDVYTVKTDGTGPVRLTRNYDALGATWR